MQAAIPQVSKVTTVSSPVKGLNAYDSIIGMGEGFAIVLRNFFAQPYGCQIRRGYRRHVTGLLGPVESICSHNTDTPHLYAFVRELTGSVLYDVTVPNAPGVQKVTGLLNARWQHLVFPNPAGVNMVAVNGADNMLWFKPDNSISAVAAGAGTGGTISGIDPKLFIHVTAHQKRLWFVEKGSLRGWYLPPEQVTGVATKFEFSSYASRGGHLVQLITWTIDDGDGADDHLVAITSEGQAIVYSGIDPDGVDTWQLRGVYYCGAPVGIRPACRYGGDIAILTVGGVVSLGSLLKSTKVNPTEENNAKYIQQLISVAASTTGDLFGWQPFIFPGGNMFIVNVPATVLSSFQFVMNDVTKAWSEFIGYQANCWDLFDQMPVYGSFGAVYRAWEGTTDDAILQNDGTVIDGDEIRAEAQTSFSYFGSLGQQKHFKMCRPTVLSRGEFALSFSVNVDFVFDTPLSPATFFRAHPGVWDEDLWDAATWEGGLLTFKTWQSVVGIGTAGAIRLLIRSSQETYWASTDWLLEDGGIL